VRGYTVCGLLLRKKYTTKYGCVEKGNETKYNNDAREMNNDARIEEYCNVTHAVY